MTTYKYGERPGPPIRCWTCTLCSYSGDQESHVVQHMLAMHADGLFSMKSVLGKSWYYIDDVETYTVFMAHMRKIYGAFQPAYPEARFLRSGWYNADITTKYSEKNGGVTIYAKMVELQIIFLEDYYNTLQLQSEKIAMELDLLRREFVIR